MSEELNRRQVVESCADSEERGADDPLRAACQVIGDILSMMALHRDSLNSMRTRVEEVDQYADRGIDRLSQRIDDLRETLGGVEAQVHELRNPPEAAPHPSPEVSGIVDSPEDRLIRRLRDALHQYDEDTIPF